MQNSGVAKFDKVSIAQFMKDFEGVNNQNWSKGNLLDIYNKLKFPKRATKCSAGYDIYSPIDFTLRPGETIKFPTGFRCKMNEDIFLMIVPRSSLGFKYRLFIDNTCGIIDSDYFNTPNEGHFYLKFTNLGDKTLEVKAGDAVAQGILLKYYLTVDDDTIEERIGGFGSTNFIKDEINDNK